MECFNSTCVTATTGVAPSVFASAIQFLAALQCGVSQGIPDTDVTNGESFHFIIVGAGTAGSVLANRLSAVPEWKVLLIEAGGDAPIESDVPALSTNLYHTRCDWDYWTAPNGRTHRATIDGCINWARGKMMGGSSSINAMIYVQGNDQDYQNWFDLGNSEWSVEEVRRCFKKAESLQDMDMLTNPDISDHYGHDGPLTVNSFNYTHPHLREKVLSAWDEIGFKNVPDYNVANVLGSGRMRATAASGERQSFSKAYLRPILNRKNLKIMKNSLVTKLIFEDDSKTVRGVEVERDSETFQLFASNEVIVSAGAINSPQLLMLSGIGPKEHLLSKEIPVVVDSPMVGQNLQDHIFVPIFIFCDETGEQSLADQQFDAIRYLHDRTGYLSHNFVIDALAFYSENSDMTYPQFQSHAAIIWKNSNMMEEMLRTWFTYKDQVAKPLIELNKKHATYMFPFHTLHPKSKGGIYLKSSNPYDYPIIDANYFGDSSDLELAAIGIKMLTKIVNTTEFRKINAFLGRMEWPACDVYELDSIDYWKCVCLDMAFTVYHPVGTCQMGPDPKTAVVDSRLRVHGVKNLRVIDASVMPTQISGNTNGPTGIVGERGAELILEDYNKL
ncbi:hypothetical protein HF086_000294 [Spodoptera exigua]|uniref:Glucose-methanol-choline oxidoreductase N-terminal domain-containing protein n=1 Tax=Spodoptera exigua TaxID=7107 RepID=A0A922M8R4_SPOEX|nr:hypothetical protein HF086_000294 [Spodoptera exigua]